MYGATSALYGVYAKFILADLNKLADKNFVVNNKAHSFISNKIESCKKKFEETDQFILDCYKCGSTEEVDLKIADYLKNEQR